LGGKYDSDKDVLARMLADKQSLFMDCKGLVLHYKVFEGSFYRSQAETLPWLQEFMQPET
jgi:hypothetical protein